MYFDRMRLAASRMSLLLLALAPSATAAINGYYGGCSVQVFGGVQAAINDPLALYAIVRDASHPGSPPFPLVRFDGPSGELQVLRQTSGQASFAVAARNADVIYLSDVDDVQPDRPAVYRSVDRGASWSKLHTFIPGCAASISVSDDGQDVVWHACGTGEISHDAGSSWSPVSSWWEPSTVFSHASDQFAYARGGIARSSDRGTSFVVMAHRGYRGDLGFLTFPDWSNPAEVYALTYGNTGIHLQASSNGGDDWVQFDTYPGGLAFSLAPGQPGRIYGPTRIRGGIVRSDDGGATWTTLGLDPGVTSTCNATLFMKSGPPTAVGTPLYPENALLILLDAAPPRASPAPVPMSRGAIATLAGCIAIASLLARRRYFKSRRRVSRSAM